MVWDVTFIVKFLSLFLYAASFPQKMLILKYNHEKSIGASVYLFGLIISDMDVVAVMGV